MEEGAAFRTIVKSAPATVEGRTGTLAQNGGHHAAEEQQGQIKQTKGETCSGQKPKFRWAGASEVKEWSCINHDDLKGILEGLKGTVENKLSG